MVPGGPAGTANVVPMAVFPLAARLTGLLWDPDPVKQTIVPWTPCSCVTTCPGDDAVSGPTLSTGGRVKSKGSAEETGPICPATSIVAGEAPVMVTGSEVTVSVHPVTPRPANVVSTALSGTSVVAFTWSFQALPTTADAGPVTVADPKTTALAIPAKAPCSSYPDVAPAGATYAPAATSVAARSVLPATIARRRGILGVNPRRTRSRICRGDMNSPLRAPRHRRQRVS